MTIRPYSDARTVINLVDCGVVESSDPEVITVLRDVLKHHAAHPQLPKKNRYASFPFVRSPSARLTKAERERLPQLCFELAYYGIHLKPWELEVLSRGASMVYENHVLRCEGGDEWEQQNAKNFILKFR